MNSRMSALTGALLLAALPACAHHPEAITPPAQGIQARQRLMPPASLSCPRDQLTSYSGRVIEYSRQPAHLRFRIHTEWDTRETVVLALPESTMITHFLIEGQAFAEGDWKRLEAQPGVLRDDMRVHAWICQDTAILPVIDWRPAAAAS